MDNIRLHPGEALQVFIAHPLPFPRRADGAFIFVNDAHRDKALGLERPDHGANLSVADTEKRGEVLI